MEKCSYTYIYIYIYEHICIYIYIYNIYIYIHIYAARSVQGKTEAGAFASLKEARDVNSFQTTLSPNPEQLYKYYSVIKQ